MFNRKDDKLATLESAVADAAREWPRLGRLTAMRVKLLADARASLSECNQFGSLSDVSVKHFDEAGPRSGELVRQWTRLAEAETQLASIAKHPNVGHGPESSESTKPT